MRKQTMDKLTLMCFKAIEIQKFCQYKIGDRVYYYDGGHFSSEFILDETAVYEHKDLHEEAVWNTKRWLKGKEWDELTGIYIWKPTQEQLQEMLIDKDRNYKYWLLEFIQYFDKRLSGDIEEGSMNELWLAFIMKEKWNKEWRNGEWIIIK